MAVRMASYLRSSTKIWAIVLLHISSTTHSRKCRRIIEKPNIFKIAHKMIQAWFLRSNKCLIWSILASLDKTRGMHVWPSRSKFLTIRKQEIDIVGRNQWEFCLKWYNKEASKTFASFRVFTIPQSRFTNKWGQTKRLKLTLCTWKATFTTRSYHAQTMLWLALKVAVPTCKFTWLLKTL